MSDEPKVDLPLEAVVCRMHGEMFRRQWPLGYPYFVVKAFERALTVPELTDAAGGDAHRLNAAIAEYGPLCRILGDVGRLDVYRQVDNAIEGFGSTALCAPCQRWRRGVVCTVNLHGHGLIESHICFECTAGQLCQGAELDVPAQASG